MDKDKELEEILNFKFSDFFHWNNARKNPDCPHVLEACWSHVVNNSEMCEDLLFSSMISMHNDAFLNKKDEPEKAQDKEGETA